MYVNESIDFSLIVAVVNRGDADKIIKQAKKAGAKAATTLFARGSGMEEAHTFFGLTLDPAREVILFLVQDRIVEDVMQAVHKAGDFDKPGTGIAFSMKVTGTTGLSSQIKK